MVPYVVGGTIARRIGNRVGLTAFDARRTMKLGGLRALLVENYGNQKAIRTGAGTKNAPYRYELSTADSSSVVPLKGGNHNPSPLPFSGSSNDSAQ